MKSIMWKSGCLLLILCAMTQLAPAQTHTDGKLAASERAFAASKIYSLMQIYFSAWKVLPELDLDIAYRNYLENALATDDRREFDLATMEFVARLHNGHTVLWDSWLTKNYGQSMGFYARPLDGKWVVQTSLMPSIEAGDVLSKIDGIEAETFFRQQQKFISGSNEAAQRHNLFFLPYLFPERFTLTLEDGRSVTVDRAANKLPAEGKTSPEGRWLTQDTGHIELRAAGVTTKDAVTIYLTQNETNNALQAITDRADNPGNYQLLGRSCVAFADVVISSTGFIPPNDVTPDNVIKQIRAQQIMQNTTQAP